MRYTLLLTVFIFALSSVAYAGEPVGGLRGEVVFSDKTTPTELTLSLSRIRAGSFSLDSPDSRYLTLKASSFSLADLPAGRYFMTLHGPDFLTLTREEVVIAANKETDLGALLVSRGKTLRGLVLDAKGRPVAGATVVADETLFLYNQQAPRAERSAVSGVDGAFSLGALPEAPLLLFATHQTLGDSPVIAVGARQEQASATLSATVSVSGAVSYDGRAAPAVISAIPLLGGERVRAQLFCRTYSGEYSLQLPPGEYLLVADLIKDNTEAIYMPSASTRITAAANEKITADFTIQAGATVLIAPQKKLSKRADYASFYLLPSTQRPKDAAALQALELTLPPEELRRTSMHLEDAEARLEDVLPGNYLLCGYTSRAGLGESAVTCQALTVSTQTQQRVDVTLATPASR